MIITDYADRDMLAIALAGRLASDLGAALRHAERALFLAAGGSTPGPVYDELSAAHLDWARVVILPTDERKVPIDHPRSNHRFLRERLVRDAAAEAQLLPLDVGLTEAALEGVLPPAVALCGMGTDMHTASLFPGAPGLKTALAPDAPLVIATAPDGQPEARLSLSARVLSGAVAKHLVITGAEKRAALVSAADRPTIEAPVRAILEDCQIHWAP